MDRKNKMGSVQSRLLSVLITSMSSGLPLYLTSQTLQAWFSDANVSLVFTGALSLVGLPYAFKFLWAPLMDEFIISSLGRRKGWLCLAQVCIIAVLIFMAMLRPERHVFVISILALGLSFFSASQDIVVDGYRVDILKPNERGMGSSIQLLGYRIGMLVSGSVALIIASSCGWKFSYFSMAMVMFVLMCSSLCIPEPCRNVNVEKVSWRSYLLPYRSMIAKKDVWIVVTFVLLYKLSDNLVFNLNMFFLLKVVHFKLSTVGYVSNVVSMAGLLLGSVIAGVLMYRISLYRALMMFGWFQLLSNLGYVWIAVSGKKIVVMAIGLFLENFCGGAATIAFVAFLMSLCECEFSASQYAMWSVVMSLPRVLLGPVTAKLVLVIGWVNFYIMSCLAGLPALGLLWYLKYKCIREENSYVSIIKI